MLGVGYDFNNDFYKEIPELKDLTLKENFRLRAELKIKEIVKTTDHTWPSVFSKHDSDAYKLFSSSNALNSHGPIVEHFKYNALGILIQYHRLPLYYKTDKRDSIFFNSITISVDSIKNGYIVNYNNRNGCGRKEVYINNLLIEERQIGCCNEAILTFDKKVNLIHEFTEYIKYKYSKDGKIIQKEYNDKSIDDGSYIKHPEFEKYTYKKDEINIIKTPFHCSNCTKGNYYNKVRLNEFGKIKESRFWPQYDETLALTYYCEYDNNQNLINVYSEFDNDHKKEILDTYKYTYYEKGYKVEYKANFELYGGNKIFDFDEFNRIKTISGSERGFIEIFEYK